MAMMVAFAELSSGLATLLPDVNTRVNKYTACVTVQKARVMFVLTD